MQVDVKRVNSFAVQNSIYCDETVVQMFSVYCCCYAEQNFFLLYLPQLHYYKQRKDEEFAKLLEASRTGNILIDFVIYNYIIL